VRFAGGDEYLRGHRSNIVHPKFKPFFDLVFVFAIRQVTGVD
jgi:hypothetical protein